MRNANSKLEFLRFSEKKVQNAPQKKGVFVIHFTVQNDVIIVTGTEALILLSSCYIILQITMALTKTNNLSTKIIIGVVIITHLFKSSLLHCCTATPKNLQH